MGSSKPTQTQTNTIPGMGQQESEARALLAKLTGQMGGQMGDLGDLAKGNFSFSPQDAALIQQIQRLTQEQARSGIQDNAALAMNSVEGNLLSRGLGGSSIEAVNKAMIGRQMSDALNQSTIQGQITSAQQLRQAALDRAGIKLNANQLLLQKILGSAGTLADLGLKERMAQTTTTQTTEKPFDWGQAAGLGVRLGTDIATGGSAEAAWSTKDMLNSGSSGSGYSGFGSGGNGSAFRNNGGMI